MAPRALVAVLLCAYTASAFVAAPKARVGALKLSAAKTDFSVAPLAGAAALAVLAAPQVAYAEVGLGGEVAGVFLGLLPLAAIVRFPASRFVRARGRPRRPAAAAARSFARGRWGSTVGINSRDPTTGTRMRLRLKPFLLPFSTEKTKLGGGRRRSRPRQSRRRRRQGEQREAEPRPRVLGAEALHKEGLHINAVLPVVSIGNRR